MDVPTSLVQIVWLSFLLIRCSSYKCSNRYEFKEEIKEALPHLKNCTKVRSLYPACNRTVTVYYTQHPPYVDKNEQAKEPHGLMPDMLKMVMDVCCYGCTEIVYKGPVPPPEKFEEKDRTLYMPLEGAFEGDAFYKYDYVPFMKVDGVSFVARDLTNKAAEYTSHLMASVFSTWPLFITALLMAFTAGCAIWILDSWFNNAEFPQKFPRGPLEGFWWAFVTMTTVGYGDKSPKSWIARIFSIVWILIGITVFSMYTSILTSALGAKTNSFGTTSFVHKKVGVLNFTSAGEAAAFEANAKLVRFGNIEEMTTALKEESISAIAVDNFILKYYMKHLEETVPGIKKHHSIKSEANSYGVLSYDKEFASLLRSFFKTNEDQRHALALHALHTTWPDLKLPDVHEPDSTFLNPSSPIFTTTVIGLVVVSIICCVIGLTCKLIFYKHPKIKQGYMNVMKLKRKKKSGDEITLRNLGSPGTNEIPVQELLTELEDFKSKWEKKLGSLSHGMSSSSIHQ